MSTEIKKDDTELIIKKTAKKLYFSEGKFDATTQEIADAAGVNRTLINYYFRSRDNLFNLVFEEAMKEEREKSKLFMESNASFKEKIALFIENATKKSLEYPYLESYLVSQINKGKNCNIKRVEMDDDTLPKFEKEVTKAIADGLIKPITSVQFLLSLVSLVSFPACMRPLLQETLKVSDSDYEQILKDRKELILNTLFIN